ncbi:MAG: 23S rRNA (guanosine(2251)-2'-O)-methyltransferase RlmB [Alphaproteobacteria bacterium]|nr:23S rRNA (guanosine(2251)-2'-O)-methyltransferase RlmB [Alphaproteobacteria bacterium]MBO4644407.1 23S rRNA (guanosine(2251)-2'-O)-methyltransferase RlmB [Alphaproteobacteria bacterium]
MSSHRKKPTPEAGSAKGRQNGVWLYGYHAVTAALQNPQRKIHRLLLGKETAEELPKKIIPAELIAEITDKATFEQLLPKGAVHQGIAALVSPLPAVFEEDLPEKETSVVVILDQVTDPHNVGAVMRSAAAFDADAVIITERNAPEATGVLAKSASGALELIPLIAASNLARTMQTLKERGYWCVGMDGNAEKTLRDAALPRKIALIMGSEGYGLRRLTAQNCDFMVKLPISPRVESLNVSNAAAIALYDLKYKLA